MTVGCRHATVTTRVTKKRRESKERQQKEQAALIKVPRLDSFLTFFSQTARNEMPHFSNGSNGPEPPDADAHAIITASARTASGDNGDVSVSVLDLMNSVCLFL